ncbi:hypothetical protein BRARA_C03660 [Brassica rapa]|uniref:F-box domain-containing protein n=1 Tax=Brassica campestris TaxID=3711 RepID=A0A398A964_BRACM|nr:hypothetical protein BRARA_C03660 [Brassica rapa]CAG7882721.1 unnamed protein product [Brassica rapa]
MMMFELPKDLVEEILSRLPATTLKQLQSTCKQWNDIINDREFARKHFSKAAKQHLVVMLKNFNVHLVSVNVDGISKDIDPSIKDIGELSLNKSYQLYINGMVHCNGLLFCITKGYTPMVWNPCTGKINWVVEPSRAYDVNDKFSFGYDYKKSCYYYKILRIRYVFDPETHTYTTHGREIYDFNSNSWRTLNVTPIWPLISRVVSLKGNAYWFSYKYKEGVRSCFLLSFDFSKEIFGDICVPFQFKSDYLVALSVIRENKLAVLLQRWGSEIEIWVTDNIQPNGNGVSWNHFLAVDLGVTIPPSSYVFSYAMSFFIDEDNKVGLIGDNNMGVRVYIVGKNYYREIIVGKKGIWLSLMCSYVPSLLQI